MDGKKMYVAIADKYCFGNPYYSKIFQIRKHVVFTQHRQLLPFGYQHQVIRGARGKHQGGAAHEAGRRPSEKLTCILSLI